MLTSLHLSGNTFDFDEEHDARAALTATTGHRLRGPAPADCSAFGAIDETGFGYRTSINDPNQCVWCEGQWGPALLLGGAGWLYCLGSAGTSG